MQEIRVLNRVLRIDGDGVRYEADPRHAEILGAMLGPNVRAISTPGLRESLGPRAQEEQLEEDKVFSLDEDWAGQEAGWIQEEEEARRQEAWPEGPARAAGRARAGRRERAAARG